MRPGTYFARQWRHLVYRAYELRNAVQPLTPAARLTPLLDRRTVGSDHLQVSVINIVTPARVVWRGLFSEHAATAAGKRLSGCASAPSAMVSQLAGSSSNLRGNVDRFLFRDFLKMALGTCRFCGSRAKLIEAHIVPRAFYPDDNDIRVGALRKMLRATPFI